jgi:hypothetical protein
MDPPDEPDGLSLEESLASLKRNALATEVHLTESIKSMKRLIKSFKEEPIEMPLQPRTRLMKWLTDRGLPVESSFQDFFETFLQEHKAEHRLDLSKRSIDLNPAACILFGRSKRHSSITLYEILEAFPTLYE